MSAPRFYLVTNDAARAALEIWCHPGNVPPWIGIVDDILDIMALPDGAVVRCYWYGSRETIAAWKDWWARRRAKGGIQFIDQVDWEKILDWADEHRKWPSLKLLHGIEPETVANDNVGKIGGDAGLPAQISIPETDMPAATPIPTVNLPAETVKRRAKWS